MASVQTAIEPHLTKAIAPPLELDMTEPSAATLKAEIDALLERSKQLRLLAADNMRASAEALAQAERLIEGAEKRARIEADSLRRAAPRADQ